MAGRRIAIHQPNYWPWLGYFDKMAACDVFVLLDDVQLSRGKSFTTRVNIKTGSGPAWLTVPVEGKSENVKIADAHVANGDRWRKKHWGTIAGNYSKARYFKEVAPRIEGFFNLGGDSLFEVNQAAIGMAQDLLRIPTRVVAGSELAAGSRGNEKLIDIVASLGGTTYVTGEGAGSARYLDEAAFNARGIEVVKQRFCHPAYPQLWGNFLPNMSILDLLFNCGPESLEVLLSTRQG